MDPLETTYLDMTRRRFFGTAARSIGAGLGTAALASLLSPKSASADAVGRSGSASPPGPHFAPKAKRVIYLHMEGAPSQLDLYDYKPLLRRRFDQDLPDSIRMGQRLTGMTSGQARFPVAPSIFKFTRYRNHQDGVWLSELIPHTASVAHELCFVHSMHTEAINHEPGITFFQTGNQQPGRPSFGSWISYGLGSANANLPSFVVLITQGFGNMQALSARFWGSGFLPSAHQGCKLRAGGEVLYLKDPPGVTREDRRRMLDLVGTLNERESRRTLDPEVQTRIAQYEMAYRMQMSVPELTDFSDEDEDTLAMYGPDVKTPGSFAANCLLARRLAERGVRFIQLYMRGWDAHNNLPGEMRAQCKAVDQPQAALIKDLRRRGMLDETLVLWAGEFGRTVYSQGTLTHENYGRDHHPRCFTVWLAGGGVKPGITYGSTDDYSYNIVDKPVEVHDLHATMLHLLGFHHERLTYRHEGRDYRLTDVFGKVVRDLLA
ncbi:MAG: DUF1501 domain-containing protein [Phycisphaerae bacterium]|nr:MAG: DUF1501 domain-containing protein [Planctomycetota bacterium]KAB2950106.1 MAG: DUF1501 domain-containing protein [Phycisphaerae bacterium]MBE7456440.1 DUF1501 domain-containing protein [Planctomycetia bacterium]MCK6465351.1 DUF1501 domain-containing protein [Phycisphaerae bacterium]MCL4719260.1 DUF1501 domain-containing protein [Phycisphaerae bacterium]